MKTNKKFLVFFGPPGSGKGTQADMLAEKIKLPVVCPGELLRHEIEIKSKIGKVVKLGVNSGKLVPDEITRKLIAARLKKKDAARGAIFDGYPRKREQQTFLIKKIKEISSNNYSFYAILIHVSNRGVKKRLGGRRACDCGLIYHLKYNPPKKRGICDECGDKLYVREDDKPGVITKRLRLFHKSTEPLLAYWRKAERLIIINGEQSIKNVKRDIAKELKKRKF